MAHNKKTTKATVPAIPTLEDYLLYSREKKSIKNAQNTKEEALKIALQRQAKIQRTIEKTRQEEKECKNNDLFQTKFEEVTIEPIGENKGRLQRFVADLPFITHSQKQQVSEHIDECIDKAQQEIDSYTQQAAKEQQQLDRMQHILNTYARGFMAQRCFLPANDAGGPMLDPCPLCTTADGSCGSGCLIACCCPLRYSCIGTATLSNFLAYLCCPGWEYKDPCDHCC